MTIVVVPRMTMSLTGLASIVMRPREIFLHLLPSSAKRRLLKNFQERDPPSSHIGRSPHAAPIKY